MILQIDINVVALDGAAAVLRDKVAETVDMYAGAIGDDAGIDRNRASFDTGGAGSRLFAPLLGAGDTSAVEGQLKLSEADTVPIRIRLQIGGR